MKVEISKAKKIRGISILILFLLILIPSIISISKNIITSIQNKSCAKFIFEKTSIKFENIYSQNLKNQITTFVQNKTQQTSLLKFNLQNFYSDLKNTFPIIKTFNSEINTNTLNLKIVGIKPFCLINNELILGNKKQLFPKTLFDNLNTCSLNKISINNNFIKNSSLPKNIYSFINQIPDIYWQNYEPNIIKLTEIYLTPKNSVLKYSFVTNQKNIFNKEKLIKAQELYQKFMHDDKFKQKNFKKNQILLMDLRFKNRIITRLENSIREGGV